jgi:hypothetical protein
MMGRMWMFLPLWVFLPSLDWALFCVKDIGLVVGYEDQVVVLLTAIEEDHSRVVKGACSRDRMEL